MRKTASLVLVEVARKHGFSSDQIIGQSRVAPLAAARQAAYYEIYTQCPHMSLPGIGRLLGGRDHTSVRHGVIRHCERIGVRYEDVSRKPVYCRPVGPYVRSINVPVSVAHYREAQRYAV